MKTLTTLLLITITVIGCKPDIHVGPIFSNIPNKPKTTPCGAPTRIEQLVSQERKSQFEVLKNTTKGLIMNGTEKWDMVKTIDEHYFGETWNYGPCNQDTLITETMAMSFAMGGSASSDYIISLNASSGSESYLTLTFRNQYFFIYNSGEPLNEPLHIRGKYYYNCIYAECNSGAGKLWLNWTDGIIKIEVNGDVWEKE